MTSNMSLSKPYCYIVAMAAVIDYLCLWLPLTSNMSLSKLYCDSVAMAAVDHSNPEIQDRLLSLFIVTGILTSNMSLSKLYCDIVAMVAVDHSNPEIRDIKSAVEELVNRLVSGEINMDYKDYVFYIESRSTLTFRCSYLQPCGSMAEETALWKSVRRQGRESHFIEFDFLVVLDNQRHVVNIGPGKCQGCRKIYIGDRAVFYPDFAESFLTALYSRINTMCNCRVDSNVTSLENDNHDSRPCNYDPSVLYCRIHGNKCNCHRESNVTSLENDNHDSRPCDQCRVDRKTGYLQIAKVADLDPYDVKRSEHCSLVLYWTNHTDSLLAPNNGTLQLTERIKRLVIRVDILPAFEIPGNGDGDQSEIKQFIIPKGCPRCKDDFTFMVSYSMYEGNAIHNIVSKKHKQSYKIIKFLYGQFIYWTEVDWYLKSYHAKVAFLTHCQTCTDEEKDCSRCVTEILQSLVESYTSESIELPEFHALKSIMVPYTDTYNFKLFISSLLSVLSDLNSLADNKQCNTQYRPCHVVDLIKWKCLELLDGKLDIEDRHGKFKFL